MLTLSLITLALTTCLQAPAPAAPTVVSTANTTIVAPAPAYTPAPIAPPPAVLVAPAPAAPVAPLAPAPAAPVAEAPLAAPPAPAAYTPPYATTPYPAPPPYGPQPYQEPPKRNSRFAFSLLPTMTFGKNDDPLSSLTLAFFFGGKFKGDKLALGYQFTASPAFMYLEGMVTRHYLTLMAHLGDRGFLSMGGGAALELYYPVALEGEGRLGVRFGPKRRGVFGGQFRLGYELDSHRSFPLRPQLGLFLGFSLF